jgi:hypothetical protein
MTHHRHRLQRRKPRHKNNRGEHHCPSAPMIGSFHRSQDTKTGEERYTRNKTAVITQKRLGIQATKSRRGETQITEHQTGGNSDTVTQIAIHTPASSCPFKDTRDLLDEGRSRDSGTISPKRDDLHLCEITLQIVSQEIAHSPVFAPRRVPIRCIADLRMSEITQFQCIFEEFEILRVELEKAETSTPGIWRILTTFVVVFVVAAADLVIRSWASRCVLGGGICGPALHIGNEHMRQVVGLTSATMKYSVPSCATSTRTKQTKRPAISPVTVSLEDLM